MGHGPTCPFVVVVCRDCCSIVFKSRNVGAFLMTWCVVLCGWHGARPALCWQRFKYYRLNCILVVDGCRKLLARGTTSIPSVAVMIDMDSGVTNDDLDEYVDWMEPFCPTLIYIFIVELFLWAGSKTSQGDSGGARAGLH